MHGSPLNRTPERRGNGAPPAPANSRVGWIVGAVLLAAALGLAFWGLTGTPHNTETNMTPNTTSGSTPTTK